MQYEGKLIAENGAELVFEFEADNNQLASDHIAHVSFCLDAIDGFESVGGENWNEPPVGRCVGAQFRRHYANGWITSVNVGPARRKAVIDPRTGLKFPEAS